jgi:FtsP/CotA-like multicopper oxidase with cupredoxin domain
LKSGLDRSLVGGKNVEGSVVRRACALLLVFIAVVGAAQVCGARTSAVRNVSLYGSLSSGWGFTADNITSPGPTIVVALNDVVNLTITNVDAPSTYAYHRFLLSYENSSTPQAGDPLSDLIDPGQTVILTFTANVSGTFTYYCTHHPTPMYGTFIVTVVVPEFQPVVFFAVLVLCTVAVGLVYKKRYRF